jgi:DNA-binding Xre family transcriptional regulator
MSGTADVVRFDEIVRGKNLSDLSRRAHVSPRTLKRLRDGKFAPLPLTRLAIAEALEAPVGTVLLFPADVVGRESV